MKKVFSNILTVFVVAFSFSCEEKDCCMADEITGRNLFFGTWLQYEYGYSPGAGYVVEPVAPEPPQTIRFEANGKMSSTIAGLSEYKFYYVQDDIDHKNRIVAFFKSDPGPSPDPSTFTTSYDISFNNAELKLFYRYCIEGCHLGLHKVE